MSSILNYFCLSLRQVEVKKSVCLSDDHKKCWQQIYIDTYTQLIKRWLINYFLQIRRRLLQDNRFTKANYCCFLSLISNLNYWSCLCFLDCKSLMLIRIFVFFEKWYLLLVYQLIIIKKVRTAFLKIRQP